MEKCGTSVQRFGSASEAFRFKAFPTQALFIMLSLCQLIFLPLRVYIKLVIFSDCLCSVNADFYMHTGPVRQHQPGIVGLEMFRKKNCS